jgi:Ca2+-binding EF-hand superfamily protein
MTQPQLKSLVMVKICNLLLAEEMDQLKETKAYQQDIKNLVNTLSKKLDREYSEVYNVYKDDNDGELGLQYLVRILESFVENISEMKSTEDLIILGERLKNYKLELA